ncbi:MAG: hypothetical protein HYV09_12965 [Deltaproteobacteria bacterium]|nr:hypothetical protein [Deltaproteobacteria bacterium]
MSLILRFVAKRGAWSGKERSLDRARKDFVRRPVDSDGLSVFEVTCDEDRQLVLAARACQNASDAALDYLEVDRELVAAIGPLLPSVGGTPVAAANGLHRSLDWSQSQLDELAARVFAADVSALRVTSADLRRAIAALDPAGITDEDVRAFVARIADSR